MSTQNGFVLILLILLFLAMGPSMMAQRERGQLHLEVRDTQGAALAASAQLLSQANQIERTFQIASDGRYTAHDLPPGVYRLSLTVEGFAPWIRLVEIVSDVPVRVGVTMSVAPVTSQVQVSDSETLVDPNRSGTLYSMGRQTLREQGATQPGRDLFELVAEEPGWLLEANGVLHPRGAEYDVQFVVDGLPLTQNRSPAFAPSLDAERIESMRVLTGNYPAEYGRKLGGVVEVTTEKDVPLGWHGNFETGGGSFSAASGSAEISYAPGKSRFSGSVNGFHTDRYLDLPVLANYTNRGMAAGVSGSYERDFSERDRFRATFTRNEVRFLTPNELVQQRAGQRQDIADQETTGQLYFQHTISPDLFFSFSGSVRDAAAALRSNPFATPIFVVQDRGYREGYGRADVAGHHGHHDWKTGVDSIFSVVHEALQYRITDLSRFDPNAKLQFTFPEEHKWDVEPAFYLQDQIHAGHWNVSAGLRFDHYRFVAQESAWSPRAGVSRYISKLKLLAHASYDRAFQKPAVENLLLSSSPKLDSLNPFVVRLPVRPGRGNFYEVGVTHAVFNNMRLDATVFRRDFQQYSDDDLLLNTGIGFPIAFNKARIVGEEVRLEAPKWGRFSGYVSYTNQSGVGQGPITGGLLLGVDAANGLVDTKKFAVTQDQRNSLRARLRFQAHRRVWLATGAQYGSGLPADTANSDPIFLATQYGPAILQRVDFSHGRVRPNFSIDAAAGADLYRKEQRSATFQIQVANIADRLNVINFASLFSGTAVAPPRSFLARLRLTF